MQEEQLKPVFPKEHISQLGSAKPAEHTKHVVASAH